MEGADGLISPDLLPYDNVIFRTGPDRPGQTVSEFLLRRKGGSLAFPYRAGTEHVQIHFSTSRDDSMATASTAAVLATVHDGRWAGDPRRRLIALGIQRPARPMVLGRPIELDGFAIDRFFVRTGDHRGGYRLPSEASADPNEAVVTGLTKSRQRPWLVLTVGMDRLAACSSLRYRKSDRNLTLVCDPLPAEELTAARSSLRQPPGSIGSASPSTSFPSSRVGRPAYQPLQRSQTDCTSVPPSTTW